MIQVEAVLLASMMLVIVGALLIVIDIVMNARKEDKGEARIGGVILIGPIPIIIGNDKSMVKWAIVLTIIAVTAFILMAVVAKL
ncbi:MAG: TIGR00304 family membrane protein [Thermocladium sp.]